MFDIRMFNSYLPNNDPLYYTWGYGPLINLVSNPHSSIKKSGKKMMILGHSVIFYPKGTSFFYGNGIFQKNPDNIPLTLTDSRSAFEDSKKKHGGIEVYQSTRSCIIYIADDIINKQRLKNNRYFFDVDSYSKYLGFDGYFHDDTINFINSIDILKRNINHPLDWCSWSHLLPIQIIDNFSMSSDNILSNNNFQMMRFYQEHNFNSKRNEIISKHISKIKGFCIMTFNVHLFKSINNLESSKFAFQMLLQMIIKFNIDLICLQEFFYNNLLSLEYIKNELNKIGYILHFLPIYSSYGNAIISREEPFIEKTIILPNYSRGEKRIATFFRLKNIKYLFCITHLEIGKRYKFAGQLLPESELRELVAFNSNIRSRQLDAIMNYAPDIILGDFNFEKRNDEYYNITKTYLTFDKYILKTTPFGTTVDFIFYRKKSNIPVVYSCTVDFQYSDHLPVLNIIQPPSNI